MLEEDLDRSNNYHPIVTLNFLKGNAVTDTLNDTEGTHELNENVLIINFENKNKTLKVNFNDFKDSDLEFSTYSAIIGNSDLHIEELGQMKKFFKLAGELTKDLPVEFIEK